jgi:hypothetical protein
MYGAGPRMKRDKEKMIIPTKRILMKFFFESGQKFIRNDAAI